MRPPPPLEAIAGTGAPSSLRRDNWRWQTFTSSLIATATTAVTNKVLHKPTVADPAGMLLRVDVGWTDAGEQERKKLSPLNGNDWNITAHFNM